jgi:cbb3-type cytochrome oxidase maturation protein
MTLIFIILPITLAIAVGFVIAFAWATKGGQFDDLTTPSIRMLFGDDDK